MKPRQYLPLVVGAAFFLNACSSNSSLSATPGINGVQDPAVHFATGSKPGPALYVLNSGGGTAFNISIYAGGGSNQLRTVTVGKFSDGFTVYGPRLFFGYPTDPNGPDGAGSLNIYSSRGAKLVRTLRQKHPFGFLTLDASGNLYTQCRGDEVCEYADAKQHVIRKIAFNKFGATFFNLATDPSGDLAANVSNGVLVFAPGQTTPYWTINRSSIGPITFDSAGDLFVGVQNCCGSTSVQVYAPKGQSPVRTITSGITEPLFLTFDTAGNLYVLNRGVLQSGQCSQPTEITEYPPGATSPSRTISSGLQCEGSQMLALDPAGNIYVPNYVTHGNPLGNVVVYAPGSDSPSRTVTSGVVNPTAVGIGP